MDNWRLLQVAGVCVAGLGVGLIFAVPSAGGGGWVALGLLAVAVGRLVPWLRRRE